MRTHKRVLSMEKLCRYVIIICLLENSGILSVSKADANEKGTAMGVQGIMKLINLDYTTSAGINGFRNIAILTDDDISLDGAFVSCTGFTTSPYTARCAVAGMAIDTDRLSHLSKDKRDAAIKNQIDNYFAQDKKRFDIPVSSIAFVEYLS